MAATSREGVDIGALRDRVGEFPAAPYLVTASPDGRPHVVSVTARMDDRRLVVPAGSTTGNNMAANPTATLLWPAPDGGDYCLIVDGAVESLDDGEVAINPTRAVLHRVTGASTELPGCISL
jgi:hypothetical protein